MAKAISRLLAATVLTGLGAWLSTGCLTSTEDRVAAWCAEAVPRAATYGASSATSGEHLVEVCTQHFTEVGDEADHKKLACQAEAQSKEEWWACHGRSGPPEQSELTGDGLVKVEVALHGTERELAESAGLLGSLAKDTELAEFIEVEGIKIGSGGLGSRGVSLGQGGGGLGGGVGDSASRGRGTGRSGYGQGGGNFGTAGLGALVKSRGDLVIKGSMDESLIKAVIKRHMNQIRYCYQRELTKNPELSGEITVDFEIAPDGSVSSASTAFSTMSSEAVEGCITGRFMRFKFPEPAEGGTVLVSYPFSFTPV